MPSEAVPKQHGFLWRLFCIIIFILTNLTLCWYILVFQMTQFTVWGLILFFNNMFLLFPFNCCFFLSNFCYCFFFDNFLFFLGCFFFCSVSFHFFTISKFSSEVIQNDLNIFFLFVSFLVYCCTSIKSAKDITPV